VSQEAKAAVAQELATNPLAVEFAVWWLWRVGQTPEEQSGRAVAEENGRGFNRVDVGFLSSLAERVDAGLTKGGPAALFLSPTQRATAQRVVAKYAGQLAGLQFPQPPADFQVPAPAARTNGNGRPTAVAAPAAPPRPSGWTVEPQGATYLLVRFPYNPEHTSKIKRAPEYRTWDVNKKAWKLKASPANVKFLLETFGPDRFEWTEAALALRLKVEAGMDAASTLAKAKAELADTPDPISMVTDYTWGTAPREAQARGFLLSRDATAFALLMEMRTGKTKLYADTCWWNFQRGRINGVLTICPNSVKTNYYDPATGEGEIPLHSPPGIRNECHVWRSDMPKKEREDLERALTRTPDPSRLVWLTMNVEALSTIKGTEVAARFLARFDAMLGVDESTRIKTPKSIRTKSAWKLGERAVMRRILTGSMITTKGPLDAYAQFRFLDPSILGYGSFYAFRNDFCIMGGFQGRQVLSYVNLDKLQALIDPFSFRVLLKECHDLPPKTYTKRTLELTPEQRRVYRELKNAWQTQLEGGTASVNLAITQIMRLHQVCGGFLPVVDPDGRVREVAIPGGNPKLDALLEVVEELEPDQNVLVWHQFKAEGRLIAAKLREEYGAEAVLELNGDTPEEDRTVAKRLFDRRYRPAGCKARFLVGQVETGGIGLTLDAATVMFYWSNSQNLEARIQSDFRTDGLAQTQSVLVIDAICQGTVEPKLVNTLRERKSIADTIHGDGVREWI
jgi:hypothetical protein